MSSVLPQAALHVPVVDLNDLLEYAEQHVSSRDNLRVCYTTAVLSTSSSQGTAVKTVQVLDCRPECVPAALFDSLHKAERRLLAPEEDAPEEDASEKKRMKLEGDTGMDNDGGHVEMDSAVNALEEPLHQNFEIIAATAAMEVADVTVDLDRDGEGKTEEKQPHGEGTFLSSSSSSILASHVPGPVGDEDHIQSGGAAGLRISSQPLHAQEATAPTNEVATAAASPSSSSMSASTSALKRMTPSTANENSNDPLFLTSWPQFLWHTRRLSFYNMPSHEAICCKLQRDCCLVYLITSTFRTTDNLALEAAVWLAQKIQKPLIAVTLIDKSLHSDVCYVNQVDLAVNSDIAAAAAADATTAAAAATSTTPINSEAGAVMSSSMEQGNDSSSPAVAVDMEVDVDPGAGANTATASSSASNLTSDMPTSTPTPAPSAARARSSFSVFSALGALQIELSAMNIPLVGILVDGESNRTEPSSSLPFSLKLECLEVMKTLQNSFSILTLFTDSTCCPSNALLCQSLGAGCLSTAVIISIDSDSFYSGGNGPRSSKGSDKEPSALDNVNTFEAFLPKFNQSLEALLLQTWSFSSNARILSAEVQARLDLGAELGASGLLSVDWNKVRRQVRDYVDGIVTLEHATAKTALLPPSSFICCWSEKRAIDALEEMCKLYDDEDAFITTIRSDCCAVLLKCLSLGLLSPTMLFRSTNRQPRTRCHLLWRDLHAKLAERDFARHVCFGLSRKFLTGVAESVNVTWKIIWAHLCAGCNAAAPPTSAAATSDSLMDVCIPPLLPWQVCAGQTTDVLFNAIQQRLLASGIVPAGIELQYWLAFYFRALVTPDLGIQTSLLEVARHTAMHKGVRDFSHLVIVSILIAGSHVLAKLRESKSTGEDGLQPFADALRQSYGSLQMGAFVATLP